MGFGWKLAAVVVLSALVDLCWAVHIRALVSSALLVAVGTVVLINYLAFAGHLWFVECPELSRRLAITTAGALGAGLGTATVLLLGL